MGAPSLSDLESPRSWLVISVFRGGFPEVITVAMTVQCVAEMRHFKSLFMQHKNRLVDLSYSCWLKMAKAFFKMSKVRRQVPALLSNGTKGSCFQYPSSSILSSLSDHRAASGRLPV